MARAVPAPDIHAFLCLLAEGLVSSLAGGGDPVLVHVIAGEEGPEVGILPLDGAAPAELLLGTVAPAEWSALGCATRGRAGPLTGHGPSSTAEVVVLVPREGEVVGRMRHGGQVHTDAPEYGLTLDCIQRALGLPTAPPQVPGTHWLATVWLEAVLLPADPGETAARFATGMDGQSLRWDRIRELVASGRWPDPAVAPEDAAWFDEGSFSRWVLAGRPPLPSLLREVAAVVGFAEARRCAGVLTDMGLDVSARTLPPRRERRRRQAG
jgi:hypothetical protein